MVPLQGVLLFRVVLLTYIGFVSADQGVDVNHDLSGGRAPLHYAADMGQTEVIQYLVSKGANVNVRFWFFFNF